MNIEFPEVVGTLADLPEQTIKTIKAYAKATAAINMSGLLTELKELRAYKKSAENQESCGPLGFVFEDDIDDLQNTECFKTIYSIEVGSPDKGESIAVYLGKPPAVAVPGEIHEYYKSDEPGSEEYMQGWNDCFAAMLESAEPSKPTVVAHEFSDDEYICIRDAVDRLISAVGKDVDGDQSECSLCAEFIDELIREIIIPLKINWHEDDDWCGYVSSVSPCITEQEEKS